MSPCQVLNVFNHKKINTSASCEALNVFINHTKQKHLMKYSTKHFKLKPGNIIMKVHFIINTKELKPWNYITEYV